ncbi:MAG: SRPBCC family protein [Candidatus Zhuqueibacterota bacterium]
MKVINVHERVLPASLTEIGKLIDNLASSDDKLWPRDQWPAMKFDRPLSVGAVGGHGPIRYVVERYQPGQSIQFRFTQPKAFLGSHRFEIEPLESEIVRLHHTIEMQVQGIAWLSWQWVIRPLHDALIEDALDRAEHFIGGRPVKRKWSFWVKFLRRSMSRR